MQFCLRVQVSKATIPSIILSQGSQSALRADTARRRGNRTTGLKVGSAAAVLPRCGLVIVALPDVSAIMRSPGAGFTSKDSGLLNSIRTNGLNCDFEKAVLISGGAIGAAVWIRYSRLETRVIRPGWGAADARVGRACSILPLAAAMVAAISPSCRIAKEGE